MSEGLKVPEFGFPADIIAKYHVRLISYELMNIFRPGEAPLREISLAVEDASKALSALREELASRGWSVELVEVYRHDVVIARPPSGELVLGVLASESSDGPVMTVVASPVKPGANLEAFWPEVKDLLMVLCPSPHEVGD
ncbi:hypothetical protein B6U66_05525 [Candidatus Bathyarchaeota archaeon ex4484_135]|nr:MAG: hypothetical protein B6U66_05525 [Candidatus Bathyarchaeota archaeon ex4484_135]